MTRRFRSLLSLVLVALSGLPSLAMAGGPGVIIDLGPTGAADVPVFSGPLLIALALLMVIVALRFLRLRDAQRMLSIAVLGAGLVIGAFGVERTVAIDIITPEVPPDDPACSGATISLNTNSSGYSGLPIANNCVSTDLKVLGYQNLPCPPPVQIKTDADVGDIIPAGGSATMNYCPSEML